MRAPFPLLRSLLVAIVLTASLPAFAVQPDEVLPDPTMEERARTLSREIRCMVCQNQSIDDSDAPLARDLRLLVRERLKAGDSNNQVVDFLVSRYGEFVLLRPRLEWHTLALWAVAPGALVIGAIALVMMARRRQGGSAAVEPATLSVDEQARLARIVKDD